MDYRTYLEKSAKEYGNIACMGIDPNFSSLPEGVSVEDYFTTILAGVEEKGVGVSAYKPNIGYFSRLDKPLEGEFSGSKALSSIVKALPEAPFILDSKRGDIATSSANYAFEAFRCWCSDAVTVSPYMGHDSISPFAVAIGDDAKDKGIYILNRTSNPGGKDLQNKVMEDGRPLYMVVAETIAKWNKEYSGGIGAVVGATNLKEFEDLAAFYSDKDVPLLIPGVGSQGGSAEEVISIMKKVGYPLHLARINSSSALTHPWAKRKERAPENWKDVCVENIRAFGKECAL
ncbi:MAG: orotidine-5'-phosphate decarboxylase [Candidatus Ornithospirochaeta sp.]